MRILSGWVARATDDIHGLDQIETTSAGVATRPIPAVSTSDVDLICHTYYIQTMIKGFKEAATEALFKGGRTAKHLRPIAKVARRKLDMLDYAETLADLRMPPGNRLEALKGDRQGQHSIRINDQWRVCFVWRSDGPVDVEIVDYH